MALMGTKVISVAIDTPTALSTTLASASTITPISIEDYEVAGTDGREAVNESVSNNATGGNVNSLSNVDDCALVQVLFVTVIWSLPIVGPSFRCGLSHAPSLLR
ncbi:hypothetical protein Tco_0572912 [Tanacetum coccineum]